jgi:hypothetical protein
MTLQQETAPKGETVYVDRRRGDRGSKGPFFVAYLSAEREERWGFYCGHCGSLDTAMDSMGRIECNDCGNRKKPDEWDAAHE